MSGGPGQSTSGSVPRAQVLCIVWTPRDQRMARQLSTVLAARPDLHVIEVNSCFAALAAFLMPDKSQVTQSSQVLVLDGPQRLLGVPEVLSRLERYLPTCKVWAYVETPKPQLRGVQQSDLAAPTSSAPSKPAQMMSPPRVVVVPGIAAKVKRVGEGPGHTGHAQQSVPTGWTPRVVGAGDFAPAARPNIETHQPPAATSDNSPTQGISANSAGAAGGLAGVTRPPSLLTDEELSMLLANDQDREHN